MSSSLLSTIMQSSLRYHPHAPRVTLRLACAPESASAPPPLFLAVVTPAPPVTPYLARETSGALKITRRNFHSFINMYFGGSPQTTIISLQGTRGRAGQGMLRAAPPGTRTSLRQYRLAAVGSAILQMGAGLSSRNASPALESSHANPA